MANRVKQIELDGIQMNKCIMCGTWMEFSEHHKMYPEWHESIYDEVDLAGTIWAHDYTVVTIGNVTKPFVCGECYQWEHGTDATISKMMAGTLGAIEIGPDELDEVKLA